MLSLDFCITYQIRFKLDFGAECFFGHSTSTDLLKHFTDVISGLDPSKNLQILMDGPNFNLKSLEGLKKEKEEAKFSKLIDLGSCNLHVVHGALKLACEKTNCGLKNLIKRVFQLVNPLSTNPTKWSNTLKQFVGKLPTICLSVFDHFVGLAPRGSRTHQHVRNITFPSIGHQFFSYSFVQVSRFILL